MPYVWAEDNNQEVIPKTYDMTPEEREEEIRLRRAVGYLIRGEERPGLWENPQEPFIPDW